MSEKNQLNENIKQFYDNSSALWEKTWGEHMHHGYYGADGTEEKNHLQAQVDLMEELLRWGNVQSPKNILDIGCGIGGSSLYLAEKFGARVTGITLSPYQVNRATERAAAAGMSEKVRFQVADALNPPFENGQFDLLWSLESGEHMPEKEKFIQKCYDLLKPGGTFLMATWCHRNLPPALSDDEQELLNRIYNVYHLPYILSINEYAQIAENIGFTNIETTDWSDAVAPFWNAVVKSVFRWDSITGLVQSGWSTIRGAMAMTQMIRGYREGLIKFGLFQGRKP
ncbi:MAG: methyltransferase domain-containing protein [Calditrichia bacterium]